MEMQLNMSPRSAGAAVEDGSAPVYRLGGQCPSIAGGVFIAPTAAVIGKVSLASGTSIWFGAVLRGDVCSIEIGEGSNVQDGAVLHADGGGRVTIGRDVTIGHRAIIHGCHIGDGALIGMGAIVLDGAEIGAGALIGAGAVVGPGKRVPGGTLWLGCPARQSRELGAGEMAAFRAGAAHYCGNAARFRDELAGPA